eukprot:TRINITY_DN11929_c1_g1_i1.p1 TRINITY_DN11929_c1_g1~~TRINITY_DN11929_c1_g1_i1.p1  ORF type:complete len:577 (+),score=159.85 TRINITY_DN11929_c1_g1_i1:70-1731(+)
MPPAGPVGGRPQRDTGQSGLQERPLFAGSPAPTRPPRGGGGERRPPAQRSFNQRCELWSRRVAHQIAQRPLFRMAAFLLWLLSWVTWLVPLLWYTAPPAAPSPPHRPPAEPPCAKGHLPPPRHPWELRGRREGEGAGPGEQVAAAAPYAAEAAAALAAAAAAAGRGASGSSGEAEEELAGDAPEALQGYGESMAVEGRLPARRRACIVHRPGRVHRVVEPARPGDNVSGEAAYFADDGCALGHLVKDATNVASHAADSGLLSVVIFSHPCATARPPPRRRGALGIGASSQLFHDVIIHWFRAAQWAAAAALPQQPAPSLLFPAQLPPRACYATVLGRAGWRWFRSPRHAALFRQGIWETLRVPAPPERQRLTVTLLRRRHNRRYGELAHASFLRPRLDGVAEVVLADWERTPYAEQLARLRGTDALVAAHGAGLANIVAMRTGSAVVELFPHNFRYLLFEELARVCGLHYLPHEARRVSGVCCRGRSLRELANVTPGVPPYVFLRRVNGLRACKNCDIEIESTELWYIVKDALSARLLTRARGADVLLVDRRG